MDLGWQVLNWLFLSVKKKKKIPCEHNSTGASSFKNTQGTVDRPKKRATNLWAHSKTQVAIMHRQDGDLREDSNMPTEYRNPPDERSDCKQRVLSKWCKHLRKLPGSFPKIGKRATLQTRKGIVPQQSEGLLVYAERMAGLIWNTTEKPAILPWSSHLPSTNPKGFGCEWLQG